MAPLSARVTIEPGGEAKVSRTSPASAVADTEPSGVPRRPVPVTSPRSASALTDERRSLSRMSAWTRSSTAVARGTRTR